MYKGRMQEHGSGRTPQPGKCRVWTCGSTGWWSQATQNLAGLGGGRALTLQAEEPLGGSQAGKGLWGLVTVTLTPVLEMRSRDLRGEGRRLRRRPHWSGDTGAGRCVVGACWCGTQGPGRRAGIQEPSAYRGEWRTGGRYDRQGEQEEVEELPPRPHPLSVEPLTESGRAETRFKRQSILSGKGSGLHDQR